MKKERNRIVNYSINAPSVLAYALTLTQKQKAEFLIDFFRDLTIGKSSNEFTQEVIEEYLNHRIKRQASGQKGGKAKASKTLASAKQNSSKTLASAYHGNGNGNGLNELKDTCSSKLNEQAFLEWYAVYPKKKGKQDALKAWKKIKFNDEVTPAMLIDSVTKQSYTDDWIKDKGQFVPLPATWLNGKRWEDEIIQKEEEEDLPGEWIGS